MPLANVFRVFLFFGLLFGGFVSPVRAMSNTGPWDALCLRSPEDVAGQATVYPPQGDFESYMSTHGVGDLSPFVQGIQCTKATAVFPGTTSPSWPLKTPWGCFFVDHLPGSDKVYYVPLDSRAEWDAFTLAAKYWLKDDLLIRPCSDSPPVCTPVMAAACETSDAAVVFVFDVSGSIGESGNFGKEIDFVSLVIDAMSPSGSKSAALGGGKDDVPLSFANEYGWVAFDSVVTGASAPGQFMADGKAPQTLTSSVRSLSGGMTAVGAGLLRAQTLLSSMRASKKVIVLISDGYNNQSPDPLAAAAAIRESGIIIVSVAVGGINEGVLSINKELLTLIAGSAERVLPVTFDDLPLFVGNLVHTLCTDKPVCE